MLADPPRPRRHAAAQRGGGRPGRLRHAQGLASMKELQTTLAGAAPRDHGAQLHGIAARPEDPERRRPAGGPGEGVRDGMANLEQAAAPERWSSTQASSGRTRSWPPVPRGGRRPDRRLRVSAPTGPGLPGGPAGPRLPEGGRRALRAGASWRQALRPANDACPAGSGARAGAHATRRSSPRAWSSSREPFAARPDAILLPELYLKSNEGLKALRDAYLSDDGTATRLQVVLDAGPYSPEALDHRAGDARSPERQRVPRAWSRAAPPCSSTCATPPTAT